MRIKFFVVLMVVALLAVACGPQATPAAVQAPTEVMAEPTAAPEPTAVPEPTAASEPTAAPTEAPAAAPAEMTGLPEVNPLEVTGDIITAGSSTVFPLSEAVAERFREEGYGGNITIDSIGTGAGFERFCKSGETDVSNASRAIKDSEAASCTEIGRTPLEFRVATDALAVVVSTENDWLTEGLTLEELAKLYSKDTTNWSDVNPAWPSEPVKRFSPGTDSGTFDYFIEAVMDPAFETGEEALLGATNLQLSEDDNVLVTGVQGDKYAIGYFGFAYFVENEGKLLDVMIEGVEPTAATVDAGEYPLARPLFIYSDAKIMAEKPQVAAYINFYLTNANESALAVGYFPAPADALEASVQAFLDATK